MPLLPPGPLPIAGLAIVLAGLALVARRGIPKAYGLGLLVLVMFAVDTAGAVLGARPGLADALGFQAAPFLAGEWWTPLTSVFVHAGFFHVFGNLFILVTAGPALEERVGGWRFLAIFFVSAAVAVAAHTLLAYATDVTTPHATAVGASGAIFGVLTAFAVRYPRDRLPIILFIMVAWMPAFLVLLIYLLFNVAYMFSATSIAWWGHFAGFLVGLAWASRLPASPTAPRGAQGLPDPGRLEPLATTPDLRRILDRLRQFTPETRTADDLAYADAWLDEFFERARCPTCGAGFTRSGLTARCGSGETIVDLARRPL